MFFQHSFFRFSYLLYYEVILKVLESSLILVFVSAGDKHSLAVVSIY